MDKPLQAAADADVTFFSFRLTCGVEENVRRMKCHEETTPRTRKLTNTDKLREYRSTQETFSYEGKAALEEEIDVTKLTAKEAALVLFKKINDYFAQSELMLCQFRRNC